MHTSQSKNDAFGEPSLIAPDRWLLRVAGWVPRDALALLGVEPFSETGATGAWLLRPMVAAGPWWFVFRVDRRGQLSPSP